MAAAKTPIFLIHWNQQEGAARVQELAGQGLRAVQGGEAGPAVFRQMRALRPPLVIIDLSRRPSHGREVAVAMRNAKWSREIPILFAGGVQAKVQALRELLPDAFYAEWEQMGQAVRDAMKRGAALPVRPPAMMDAFGGAPLVKKLAIKPGMKVQLIAAPEGFAELLGALPEGAELRESSRGAADLRIWFVRNRAELETRVATAASNSNGTPLWIAYPKKSSRLASDLTQQDVREMGLAAGMVDYKVCAIDADWTGLLFSTKRK